MKTIRRAIYGVILALCSNFYILIPYLGTELETGLSLSDGQSFCAALIGAAAFLWILCHPGGGGETRALRALSRGTERLRLFLISATLTLAVQLYMTRWAFGIIFPVDGFGSGVVLAIWFFALLLALLCESAVFWVGILPLYLSSVQLGIRHRVLGVLCAWIPGLNIYYLTKLIHTVETEAEIETEKLMLDSARSDEGICKTRYPILLVHGVFFRDFRYLNYWGRIPGALKKNGAEVYYGEQQSAASVESCGAELSKRNQNIVNDTGFGKVNIIAHSKGGLDSRAAISHFGAAPYVASLTTINTPHRGCIFAEYLLSRIPEKVRSSLAGAYNAALKKLGDSEPDFLCAVNDLTASACEERNKLTPDAPGVLYESVMSYCKRAKSGRFPLNVSYPLVKYFDGKNDGLVSVDSARWGVSFMLLEPTGERGISHADMIDLNRENIPGFDVREFYVALVSKLRERGL